MNNFTAVGVETGLARGELLTAIGLVRFEDGNQVESYYAPVQSRTGANPETSDSPVPARKSLRAVLKLVGQWADGGILVCHGPFTRDIIRQACTATGIEIQARWLDTSEFVPRVVPRAALGGLDWMAQLFRVPFGHRSALASAKTYGSVFAAALEQSGTSLESSPVEVADHRLQRGARLSV
jgi:DNA polymerase III alpha subunit (gram-positive type)